MGWCVFFPAHLVKNGKYHLIEPIIIINEMFLDLHFHQNTILTFSPGTKKILAKYLVQCFNSLQTNPIGGFFHVISS